VFDRILGVLRRATIWEVAALVSLAAAPFVVGIALIAGAWLDSPLVDVGVVLAYLIIAVLLIGGAVLSRRALRRRLRGGGHELSANPSDGGPVPIGDDAAVLAAAAQLPLAALRQFGTRTGSTWVRDVLAHRASGGRLDYAAVVDVVTAANRKETAAGIVLGELEARAMLALIGTLSAVEDPPTKSLGELLRFVARMPGSRRFTRDEWVSIAERLVAVGDLDAAEAVVRPLPLDDVRVRMLAADLVSPRHQPVAAQEGRRHRVWLDAINQIYRPRGFDPLSLGAAGTAPFDRLTARGSDRRTGGPLVSVIMTCFRPDESLLTAVRSIVEQSWSEWELLVMDDGSPSVHHAILERAAELDPRVRVIRARENAGTYVRRNDGLRVARGEFVTFHDSDDWAHPRRLETQVVALLDAPESLANLSASARVTSHLDFVTPRGTRLRPAETSLLFRRERVLGLIGYYDRVRRAGDSEYRLRLEARTGRVTPMIEPGLPLTLVRYDSASLSGSDFRDGWMHPARVAYRSAASSWHDDIRAGHAPSVLSSDAETRPFPAPPHILGTDPEPLALDVLLVLDGRSRSNPSGWLERVAEELEGLVRRGLAAGVLHVDSLGTDTTLGLFPRALQSPVNAGRVARVLPGDDVRAGVVLVRDASVLQGLPPEPLGPTTDRVIVVHDGTRPEQHRRDYARRTVERLARALFGGDVVGLDLSGVLDYDALLAPPASSAAAPSTALDDLAARFRPQPSMPVGTTWAASPATLTALVDAALRLPPDAVIVELGSGISTVWLALAIDRERPDIRLVSLDHDTGYADQTRAMLRERGIGERADVRLAELQHVEIRGEMYRWYDPEALVDIERVDLLFVDGPPAAVRRRSRYPAFPLLGGRLGESAVLVVDDFTRADESEMVAEWIRDVPSGGHLEVTEVVDRAAFLRFQR